MHGCGLLECSFGIDYVYSLHCMEDDPMANSILLKQLLFCDLIV
jgi:hypothetical protein